MDGTSVFLRLTSSVLAVVALFVEPAIAAPSLLDVVKSAELAPSSCHVARMRGECAQFFSVLAQGHYQQVAPIFSSTSAAESYAKLFPKCVMARREDISGLSSEDLRDPLHEMNLTDHIHFLPTSFRLFSLTVNGKRERILIASNYVGSVDVKVEHSIAYVLDPKRPCHPQFISLAGYPSYGAGEGHQLDVIRIDGIPFILSITQFSPGGTAAHFQLTQVPNRGTGRDRYKNVLFSTR